MSVDKQIAASLIAEELRKLRTLSYRDLVAGIGKCEHKEVAGADGKTYQLEIEVFWDSRKKHGDVRVMVAADDGGCSAFKPLTDSFIIAPDDFNPAKPKPRWRSSLTSSPASSPT